MTDEFQVCVRRIGFMLMETSIALRKKRLRKWDIISVVLQKKVQLRPCLLVLD